MIKKKLSQYLEVFNRIDQKKVSSSLPQPVQKLEVSSVTSDSREVKSGSIFVAVRGLSQDGHQYLEQAEKQGAVLLVGELEAPPKHLNTPYLQVQDSRIALAQLASFHFDDPSRRLLMVGVTGTSGKTTTTYLLESILQSAGYEVGMIGTINFRYRSKIFPSTHTTPGAVELQGLLAEMKSDGCTAVIMEVSSHALKQYRAAGIAFDAMLFTNLSPEHLDFHPDMEDYFQAKAMLFKEMAKASYQAGKKPVGVINTKDPYGERLFREIKAAPERMIEIEEFKEFEELNVSIQGIRGKLEKIEISSALTGLFNSLNLSGAATLGMALKIPSAVIQKGISGLEGVPGRLQRVENSNQIHIWVDYAHKADALEKVLATLKEIRGVNRLITVVGCGGDRDRKKRPLMGKIAVTGSDYAFITSDNPRTEDPMAIIEEILTGVQGYSNFEVEVDRKKAIFAAILSALPGDLVLIAGKGHEDYQILGKTKIHFDDREIAEEACRVKTRLEKSKKD